MRAELKDLQRRAGITFLFVTHDQEEALSLSDAMAVMNSGVIEQFGSPREVYLRPKTRFVASFLGSVNWIDGVGIRPEATGISRAEIRHGRQGKVTGTVFLGNLVQVHVRLDTGEEAHAEIPRNAEPFQEGDTVHLHWNPQDEMHLPG